MASSRPAFPDLFAFPWRPGFLAAISFVKAVGEERTVAAKEPRKERECGRPCNGFSDRGTLRANSLEFASLGGDGIGCYHERALPGTLPAGRRAIRRGLQRAAVGKPQNSAGAV